MAYCIVAVPVLSISLKAIQSRRLSNLSSIVSVYSRYLTVYLTAVGAYMSMVLEGFLNSSANDAVRSMQPFVGAYSNKIHCYTLGSPPCVSRAVVPRFITSVLCGDDVVPRASPDSLEHVRGRVLKALKSGAGKGALGSIGWVMGTGWLADLTDVAG
jgi:hypothetical protein